MNKEVNEKKKRYAIVITFLVLMICITGGTYAYFALTASNNSVTGSVGGASLNLTVTKVYPTSEHNNKNMIPQLESTLDEAISTEHKCIDDNGNVICQVYSATVTNQGSTTSVLNGTISFEGVEREAGLYDDNWNLLASWDELVDDYGLDITSSNMNLDNNNALTMIINNNSEFSTVTKIIIDDNVSDIGFMQFYDINNCKEIALPNNVAFYDSSEVGYMSSSLEKIYYSGSSEDVPWGAENATILSRDFVDPIPNLKWMRINDSNTLGTYSSFLASTDKSLFESERSFGANTSQTYYFVFWIDETGEVQYDNGDFRANIEFNSSTGGLTSTVRPLFTDYIEQLYNDGSEINSVRIADDESKKLVNLNSNQKLMMIDQGDTYGIEYRYYGASPNNYVDFNGELWRIVSVSKVFSSETDTTGETRVRIIKDTLIGNYPWDDDSNNWADATLMCQLNTMYYNDTVPACTGKSLASLNASLNAEARGLIDNALWYLGGGDTSNLYADDYYNMERNNSGYGSNPTRWTGKVGIMYPSDYAYATDLSQCKNTGYYYYSDETNCLNTDWLFNGEYQWLMSPFSDSFKIAWYVNVAGNVNDMDGIGVVLEYGVRPLAVLKSNVIKTGGSGASGDPYKIALSE